MIRLFAWSQKKFDQFLFDATDARMCSVLRVGYATLLLVMLGQLAGEAEVWFTDGGVLRSESAEQFNEYAKESVLFWLPATPSVVYACLGLLFFNAVLLLLGCWSRLQAVFIFVGLTSFQHRNPLIFDGEDTVFRLMIFFMIFMPLDHSWSLSKSWTRRRSSRARVSTAWALRLVQFEMTAIYLSTAWSKWQGETWRDGTALYYVSRMEDVFGRGWLPDWLFETPGILHSMTWSVLLLETLLPVLLWIPATRRYAILLGIGLHLSIEYAMHLFLFEWIMILGLLSFVKLEDLFPRTVDGRSRDSQPAELAKEGENPHRRER